MIIPTLFLYFLLFCYPYRAPSRRLYTREEAIALLDDEGEMEDTDEPCFAGSDDDLGFSEDEDEDEDRGSDSEVTQKILGTLDE